MNDICFPDEVIESFNSYFKSYIIYAISSGALTFEKCPTEHFEFKNGEVIEKSKDLNENTKYFHRFDFDVDGENNYFMGSLIAEVLENGCIKYSVVINSFSYNGCEDYILNPNFEFGMEMPISSEICDELNEAKVA